ncbi:hypothetical protein FB563_8026 [Streptomyces puniciscabiei]|uniref:Uncharacterized protein n=1 Tax=Streptomyces puniciscabiei TaxID=164348 RepID=A0A542SYR3_9ACTN|nr:hypothetical protein FB563_8026 [Streptomyces puniciscabiei]
MQAARRGTLRPGCPASRISFSAICRPSTGTSAASDVPPGPARLVRPLRRPRSLQLSRAAFDSKLADEVLEKGIAKGIENALAFID